MNPIVSKLLDLLQRPGRPVAPEELLDALWIAPHLPAASRGREVGLPDKPPTSESDLTEGSVDPSPPEKAGSEPSRFPIESAGPMAARARPGHPLRLPAGAPALRGREVVRALRPFLSWAPAPSGWELDEEATIDLRCATRLPLVQLRPQREKATSACLVIDSSASMDVWDEVVRDWVRLIAGAGVFRNVRLLRLDADGTSPKLGPWLRRADGTTGSAFGRATPPPGGVGSVVLVLSDCCSRGWWNGSAFRLLAEWSRAGPLGLVCLLPEQSWERTAIKQVPRIPLIRPADGPLFLEAFPGDEAGDVLPLASLEARSLRGLAGLIGHNRREIRGLGLWIAQHATDAPTIDLAQLPARERIRRFFGAASSEAGRLAGLLTLFERFTARTLRLIRAVVRSDATAVQDAEVLLGGLMHAQPMERNGRSVWEYQFHDDVREALFHQSAWDTPQSQRFFARLNDYLARRREGLRGMRAAIPLKGGDSVIHAMEDQFLDVDAELLGALGGDCARIAGELETVRGLIRKSAASAAVVTGRDPATVGLPRAGEQMINSIGMPLRWIPPTPADRPFLMGSPPDEEGRFDDENQVQVILSNGFWLGQYQVTQGQWQRVMGTTLHQQRDKVRADSPIKGEGPEYPMYYVNHDEAVEFALKLTEIERREGRLPADWEYRLPTEAQWEYACRAGTTGPYSFDGGAGRLGEYAWYGEDYRTGSTHPVGGKLPNAWGLYDMHGNVWEWCADWYARVLSGGENPTGPSRAADRVLRGGSWSVGAANVRSAYRVSLTPADRNSVSGFRVAAVSSQ